MAKKNYYGVKIGKKVGVFDNWKETSEQVTGFKGAQFKGFSTITEAYEYVGLSTESLMVHTPSAIKSVSVGLGKNTKNNKSKKEERDLIKEYRDKKDDKARIKFMSSLDDEDKNKLYLSMTKEEISHYKKIASDLMEKRFSNITKNKEILDYLLLNPINVQYNVLDYKYNDVDLSITVYTIKAIINVMGESNFSKDDGSSYFNPNSRHYYSVCKKYWDKIWWDTDTGVLSKEDIERRNFTEYHKSCNKVTTISKIRRYLHLMNITDFSLRYSINSVEGKYSKMIKQQELAKIKKLEAKKRERELDSKRKSFHEKINNPRLSKSISFDKHAKELGYNLDNVNLALYRAVSEDSKLAKTITEEDALAFKKKALYTIENHYKHEYNKEFVIEAVNVLKNLIL